MDSLLDITNGIAYRRDPRVRSFWMQSSCVPMSLVMAAYLVLVSYGPRFMKNRPTPPLKMAMTVYNVGQVSRLECRYSPPTRFSELTGNRVKMRMDVFVCTQ